jgi:hypothetical protein
MTDTRRIRDDSDLSGMRDDRVIFSEFLENCNPTTPKQAVRAAPHRSCTEWYEIKRFARQWHSKKLI